MAEEIDDNGFYREDFSTDSDWEVFNAQLCEILQRWELADPDWGRAFERNELFNCEWQVQSEKLELLKKEITVDYYKAQLRPLEIIGDAADTEKLTIAPMHADLMALLNTFGPPLDGKHQDLHPLARLYGLRRFVLLRPLQRQIQYLTSPSEFSFFLSAVTVVVAEVGSTVPIFVQIYDPKWNFFVGVGVTSSLRTNFDLVALDQSLPDCLYLSGLLNMFKEKLPGTYLRPATVSVRNTYSLDSVRVRIRLNVPFSRAPPIEDEIDTQNDATALITSQFTALPYGYFPNSCTEMFAIYTWPEIAENIAIDSAMRSDFVPSKAPYGNIHQVVQATSYLSSCLRDFVKLNGNSQALEYFVGRNFSGAPRQNAGNASGQQTKKLSGPMNESELNQMLYYLFPDKQPDVALFPYTQQTTKEQFDPHRIKSAVADSLACRLSCLLATCHAHFGGKSGLAQLWAAFTRELRSHWDDFRIVQGVASSFPDTRTCLLHQKLQMLNVCIERHKLAEHVATKYSPPRTLQSAVSDEEEDNEDEFYECGSNDDEQAETQQANEDSDGKIVNAESIKPEGREKQLGELKLLDSDEALYVPVIQEPVPKTEDQLHDDAEAMLKLGPGSGLTTQMMCSSLLSDMEAFKAANPQAKMEDFIRWYSPKDWEETIDEETGNVTGTMSARMLAPDNTWQTVWKQARPVAAWRQKRLFDETNEAIKVLQYLETRSIGEIYELSVVPVLHAAILKLKDIFTNCKVFDLFNEQFTQISADLSRLSRDIEIVGETETGFISQTPNPEPILRKLEKLELQFYQYKCFERVCGYPHCTTLEEVKRQFAEILRNDGSCNLVNRRAGRAEGELGGMLNPSYKNEMREQLISKDYVIRLDGETTSTAKGKAGPQFLRAIVTGEKIRLCGAFTENTTFI